MLLRKIKHTKKYILISVYHCDAWRMVMHTMAHNYLPSPKSESTKLSFRDFKKSECFEYFVESKYVTNICYKRSKRPRPNPGSDFGYRSSQNSAEYSADSVVHYRIQILRLRLLEICQIIK